MPDSLSLDLFHASRAYQDMLGRRLTAELRATEGIAVTSAQLDFLSALICGENTASFPIPALSASG